MYTQHIGTSHTSNGDDEKDMLQGQVNAFDH